MSSALKTIGDEKASRRRRNITALDLEWQTRAYELYDLVGELSYVLNLKAFTMAKGRLVVQEQDNKGKWTDTERPEALNVMNAFQPPQGGQFELLRRAGLHLGIAGEAHLLGTPSDGNGIWWEFLSIDEVRVDSTTQAIRRRDGGVQEKLPDDSYLARMWRAHPRHSDRADSEVKRIMSVAEEIVVISRMIEAISRSRIPADVLFVAEELYFPDQTDTLEPADDEAESDANEQIDPFTKRLFEHLTTPIDDPASAASLVPLVVRGPFEMRDGIKRIELAREISEWAQKLRQEALGRLANGMDTPPEIMSGKAGLNDWSAFSVDADFIIKHVVPMGELLAEFLTVAYLRPCLEAFEGLKAEEVNGFRIVFDPSPLMARQDEAGSAQTLHDKELLSDKAVVAVNGFDESDMPDDDELFQRRAWRLIELSPDMFAKELLPRIRGFADVDTEKLSAPEPDAPAPNEPKKAAAPKKPHGSQPDMGEPTFRDLVVQLATASDAAVDRALERAGARVRSRVQRTHAELRERIRNVESQRVLELVSPDDLVRLGISVDELLADAWDGFAVKARDWVRAWLIAEGKDAYQAGDLAALIASDTCRRLDDDVRARLHGPFRKFENGLLISTSLIVDAVQMTPIGV